MAALTTIPPPRTPSPKIRIRSQSFDSPSSRISVTPIDDSPYSKSTSAIAANTLPRYNVAKAADQGLILSSNVNKVILHTKMSDDSMLSTSTGTSDEDDEEDEDADSEASVSSTNSNSNSNPDDDSPYPLFNTVSPNFPLSPSSPSSSSSSSSPTSPISPSSPIPPAPTTFQIYQDPNTPMYDPWLVRVVLDMFDIRGLDWFMIAEPIERLWGFRTSSAEVLGILCGNGRVGRVWWD